jgi:hypothetical protein
VFDHQRTGAGRWWFTHTWQYKVQEGGRQLVPVLMLGYFVWVTKVKNDLALFSFTDSD